MNTQQTNQTKRVPFDLAKWKPGVKCFYRDGEEARVICTDGRATYNGIAQPIVTETSQGNVRLVGIGGKYWIGESSNDLFMELPTTRRALTMADIPTDRLVWFRRTGGASANMLVTAFGENSIYSAGIRYFYEELNPDYEYSTDGCKTWKPCYIEE